MAYAPKSPDLSSFFSADPTTEGPASAPAAQSATAGAQRQQLPSQQSPPQFSQSQDGHLQPPVTTYFPSEPTTPGQGQHWRSQQQQSPQPLPSQANKHFPAEPATVSSQQKHPKQQQTPLTPQSQRSVGRQQQAFTYSPYLSSPAGQTVSQAIPGYTIPRQPQKAPFYQSYDTPYQPQAPIPPAQFYGHSNATPTTPATSVPPGALPLPVSRQGQGPSDFGSTVATSAPTSALGSMPPKRGGTAVAGSSAAPAVEPSPADRQIGAPRTVDSAELFAGGSEVFILHNGVQYRLRITRQDKLILTK